MSFSSTLVALLQKGVIYNLDAKTVIFPHANRKYEGDLRKQGDTVTVQTLPDVEWNRGQTAGAAITDSGFTVTSENLTVEEVDNVRVKITDIDKVQYNRSAQSDTASRIADGIAQNMDKFTAGFVRDAHDDNKTEETTGSGAGVTLDASNVHGVVVEMTTKLDEKNVPEMGRSLFATPAMAGWLRRGNWIDSSDKGVGIRLTGKLGNVDGLPLYKSNNLPYVTDLNMATNPTADDTFVLLGVTFTFKAVPAAAGEIDIGSDAAATQANVVNAINGTGTPGATTYIELSDADRLTLKQGFVFAKAFDTSATDVAPIYSAVSLSATETFTAAADDFSAEGRVCFVIDNEAINVVTQLTQMKTTDETDAFASNILGEYVYDGKVFGENSKRITTVRVANG